MTLALRRETNLEPDIFVEHLEVDDDGAASLWRSAGWATDPPTPVGRFGGTLSVPAFEAPTDDLDLVPQPGSPLDIVTLGSVTAVLGRHQEPDGPWAPVVEVARRLLVEVTTSPVAGLDLRAGDDGLRLVHVGGGPVAVDGGGAYARAERVDENESVLGEWQVELSDLPTEVGPGWSAAVELPPAAISGPGRLRGFAFLGLNDGGTRRPVSLTTRRD